MEGQYFTEDTVSHGQLNGNDGTDGATTLDSLARAAPPQNPPTTDRHTALPATVESDSLLFFLMHLASDKIDRTVRDLVSPVLQPFFCTEGWINRFVGVIDT